MIKREIKITKNTVPLISLAPFDENNKITLIFEEDEYPQNLLDKLFHHISPYDATDLIFIIDTKDEHIFTKIKDALEK